MTHDRAQPLLLDLAYGELSPDEAREVERHVSECSRCAAQLEELLATRRLVGRIADEPVPARGRAELLAAARRAVPPAGPRRWLRARTYAVAASAAVIALAAGVTLRLSGERAALPARDDVHMLRDVAPLENVAPSAVARSTAPPPALSRPPAASPTPRPTAKRQVAPAPASAPATEPMRPIAAAPARSEAPRAAQAARRAEVAEAGAASGEPRSTVEDIERRATAGQLEREEHRLTCDGIAVERAALLDGPRVVKLTIRAADGAVREGWYDRAGRLRAVRHDAAERAVPSFPDEQGAAQPSPSPDDPPARAPAREALPRCGW